MGHVRSVSGETITLDTPEGPRLFQVGADVQVFRAGKDGEEPATLEEIGPGERLAVFGRFEGNGRQQLIAERLVLLPQPEGLNQRAPGEPQPPSPGGQDQPGPRPQLVGQVRSISGETITLDTPQGPRLFQLGENVEVFRRDQGSEEPALLEEIIPGDHLAVFGRFEGNGGKQLIAERLVLLPPPPDKQP